MAPIAPKWHEQMQSPAPLTNCITASSARGIPTVIRHVEELKEKVARMHQEGDPKVGNVLFERDGLQECLDSMDSQLFGRL